MLEGAPEESLRGITMEFLEELMKKERGEKLTKCRKISLK